MGTIVVGVDGSDESKQALRWAAEEAALRRADLRVVHTYDDKPPLRAFVPPADGMSAEQRRHWYENLEREASHVWQQAEEFVASVVREVAPEGVEVETVVLRERHPAHALVEQSDGAEMLIVGSRGLGGFTGLVLGSVSQHCLHHATCPVTVIRPEQQPAR